MYSRRSFLKTAGAAAAVSTFGIRTARSADDLNWSIHCDLTGPAAEGGKFQGDGFTAYANWINAKGGIRGRKVNATINDSTFKVDVAVANVKKALAQGRVDYLFGESTGMIQAISPENNSTNKIFMTSGSFASELADEKAYPYHFVPGATYGAQLKMLVQYIKDSSGSNPAKLVIVHSSTGMGRDGIEAAVAFAKELGIEVAMVQQTKFVETDVSSFALAIRQAQPTHVIHHGYSFAVWPEVIRLVRDYGMEDVVFMGTVWQSERAKLFDLRDVTPGLVGIKVWNDDTVKPAGETMQIIGDMLRKQNPNFSGYARLGFLDAWISSMMATKAFEIVLDAGQEVNGDNLAAAMRTVKDWDTGGLIGAPVTIEDQQIGLGRVIRFTEAENLEPELLTEWVKVG
ncbi:ABC transporter substrate-binding protein [Mesorhizobium sp. DCY119]|uniref:substrate-binding domain-containing protein n=1 Tax=Mesorhizobium sp. DCY119 TaxID=2108445 RepID=UPI000E72568D|nr:ABC transporter substrate-binding protein [Mesorhizobium sp. DCY119]RJG40861.1 twin-arginine translocation signal domain-containing protein [Mesorhizobium sp. DCY119]